MQKLKAPPTLLAEKGQIEYVALLILALENPIPDPEGNMTTYDLSARIRGLYRLFQISLSALFQRTTISSVSTVGKSSWHSKQ